MMRPIAFIDTEIDSYNGRILDIGSVKFIIYWDKEELEYENKIILEIGISGDLFEVQISFHTKTKIGDIYS